MCLRLLKAVAVLVAVASGFLPATASAGKVLARFCSPDAGYCTGIFIADGRYWLDLRTSFSLPEPYKLCGREPGYAFECNYFRLRPKSHGRYESRVDLTRHFGSELGHGLYAVRWRARDLALGPTLRFRVG